MSWELHRGHSTVPLGLGSLGFDFAPPSGAVGAVPPAPPAPSPGFEPPPPPSSAGSSLLFEYSAVALLSPRARGRYAHQMITTLFVTRLPTTYKGPQYDARGWPVFERASAELIKPSQPYVVEAGKPNNEGRLLWEMAIDSSRGGGAGAGRRLPLAPALFEGCGGRGEQRTVR